MDGTVDEEDGEGSVSEDAGITIHKWRRRITASGGRAGLKVAAAVGIQAKERR
jgi:hypothetical protein